MAYQKGNELNLNNENYHYWITSFFEKEYQDDIGTGDITSRAVLKTNDPRKGILKTKKSGILAGIEEVTWFLREHQLNVKIFAKDGQKILKGDLLLEITGKQKNILRTERIALNVLQRMSGIATETMSLVNRMKAYNTRIAATRKTLLRYFDKKAVFLGGGLTHRFGLWDSILIKNNHLENLKNKGIKDYIDIAISRASTFANSVFFIEIEVTSHEEALLAAVNFKKLDLKIPCIIMLDNMNPRIIQKIIENLREEELHSSVLLEASGGITPENIIEYAKVGIDVISMGYLTHSPKVLDMNLEMTH
ncbi:carboxylating nicotinate-nucleotide diphosphorylase [Candidatus Bathyarchaeota archaeon]|nr:carboxylating nicotinate-nucleotide diphosphorylase [Candidatus Bathyarchaeota archaeon]